MYYKARHVGDFEDDADDGWDGMSEGTEFMMPNYGLSLAGKLSGVAALFHPRKAAEWLMTRG